jgi:hypothetical protein
MVEWRSQDTERTNNEGEVEDTSLASKIVKLLLGIGIFSLRGSL